jgi:hypothetical protein
MFRVVTINLEQDRKRWTERHKLISAELATLGQPPMTQHSGRQTMRACGPTYAYRPPTCEPSPCYTEPFCPMTRIRACPIG